MATEPRYVLPDPLKPGELRLRFMRTPTYAAGMRTVKTDMAGARRIAYRWIKEQVQKKHPSACVYIETRQRRYYRIDESLGENDRGAGRFMVQRLDMFGKGYGEQRKVNQDGSLGRKIIVW